MYAALHTRADSVFARVEWVGLVIAGIALVSAMLLVSADALLRYAFSAPLAFQLHVSEFYLLPASMMMAMAWGYRNGGTIQIMLLLASLPETLAGIVTRLGLALATVYMGYLTWRASITFWRAWEKSEVVMGVLDWPVSLSWIWVFLGCALLTVRLFLDAISPKLRPIGMAHE